jgi:quinol monooxygenase YgiN
MVVGILRFPITPGYRGDVLEVLRSIEGLVRAQPGCKPCHIFEEQGLEPAAVLVERWESREMLEFHIRSEFFRRILDAIELAAGPPEVSFDIVSATEGMELIERLRTVGATDEGT